ncbi:MAG: AAA family ATPase [Marinibacterium sp.]|nr:AAA family ATPase [Marinibacterium sp.]
MAPNILVTGCSGGGKSSLIAALGTAGWAVVHEPGQRILARGGPLPWLDMPAFARSAITLARDDLEDATGCSGPVVFDRGLVDAAVALDHSAGVPLARTLAGAPRYDHTVFLAPPWPEIYEQTGARRHGFADAQDEYHRLRRALGQLGYSATLLPRTSVQGRVAFVQARLGLHRP